MTGGSCGQFMVTGRSLTRPVTTNGLGDFPTLDEPALRVHVRPALEPQCQFALPRLDADLCPERFILEAARHIHQHLTARQPALTAPVNVCVRDLPQAQVAADVDVPGAEVRVKVIVMAVGLIGNAFRRAEVDTAGDGSSGFVIKYGNVNPVPAAIHDFQLQAQAKQLHQIVVSWEVNLMFLKIGFYVFFRALLTVKTSRINNRTFDLV